MNSHVGLNWPGNKLLEYDFSQIGFANLVFAVLN